MGTGDVTKRETGPRKARGVTVGDAPGFAARANDQLRPLNWRVSPTRMVRFMPS